MKEGRKEGRKDARKEGRKEGRKCIVIFDVKPFQGAVCGAW
jgi:hypothetical protein